MPTPLLDTLGIDVPILQSGMGGVAGPELVATVSSAGALGTLAALNLSPERVRAGIRTVRDLTGAAFGVNIWLHDELQPPIAPSELSSDRVAEVQAALNGVRSQLGLEPVLGAPSATPDLVGAALEVMVEERIPVFCAAIGLPSADLVERFHRVGSRVVAMVASVGDALDAVGRGVDVVVAQGAEAGGHRSHGTKPARRDARGTGTIALVPAVVDAVGGRVPVVAAGGIADGRGLAAALMLGAQGVLFGTRFVATAESGAHDAWKRALLAPGSATVLTDAFTGQWARSLDNAYVRAYEASGAATLPSLLQTRAANDVFEHGRAHGDADFMPLYAGESAALIEDLPSSAEVVRRIVAEAEAALGRPLGRSSEATGG